MRRRADPDTSGRLTSFSIEVCGGRALLQSSWCVHHCPLLIRAVHVRDIHFNSRWPSGLNKPNLNISTARSGAWGDLCMG